LNEGPQLHARNIGYAISNVMSFNWNLTYQPVDSLFQDKNINYTDGSKWMNPPISLIPMMQVNRLYAAYVGINLPFRKLKIYTGLRVEKNLQSLDGFDENGAP